MRARHVLGSPAHQQYLEYQRALYARHKKENSPGYLKNLERKRIHHKVVYAREKAAGSPHYQQYIITRRARYHQNNYASKQRARRSNMPQTLWDALLSQQQGCCAICHVDFSLHDRPGSRMHKHKMCADHDHKLKVPRGILCSMCNSALGHFSDRSDLCRAAAAYLDEYALKELL